MADVRTLIEEALGVQLGVADGVYEVELHDATVVDGQSGPRLRLVWRITEGDFEDQRLSDTLGWYGADEAKTATVRRIFAGAINRIFRYSGVEPSGDVLEALVALRNAQDYESAYDAMASLANALIDLQPRLRVRVREGRVGYVK